MNKEVDLSSWPRIVSSSSIRVEMINYDICEKAFGVPIDYYGIFIQENAPIEQYLAILNREYKVKGRTFKRVSEIPDEELPLYTDHPDVYRDLKVEGLVLEHPPLTSAQKRKVAVRNRIKAVSLVEKSLGFRLKEFKNIDNHPSINTMQLAQYLYENKV